MSRKRRLYLIVFLQVLFLASIFLSYYAVDFFGKEIRLKTAPVDPRDLFYGDYVILNYEISRLDLTIWQGTDKPGKGDAVYVVLKKSGEFYSAHSVFPDKPAIDEDEAILKGRVSHVWENEMSLTYGLERFYVAENTGLDIERNREQVRVLVKVAPWGQAKISELEFVDNS